MRPNGSAMVGPQAILTGQTEGFARFRATHHVITDHVLDLDGDIASLRANLTAMHLWAYGHTDPGSLESYFLAGGVLRAVAVRAPAGWQLSELQNRIVWRTGAGFGAMAQTGRPGQN
jgi:SnoaL-like domain